MKRFLICLLLVIATAGFTLFGDAAVQKRAEQLSDALEQTRVLLQQGQAAKAEAAATTCVKLWDAHKTALFIYLDHESFDDLTYLLPQLPAYLGAGYANTVGDLLVCEGILDDLIRRQQVDLENIF